MSLLHRFLRLNDHEETGIFTFIVTKSVTRDLHRDVTSKEFSYGHQRWAITFTRHDKHLGVYLVWKNPSAGMRVFANFSITLLNRDHFSENQTFAAKNIKYTQDAKIHGCRKFVALSTLESGHFMDRNGEFQLEFSLSSIQSVFEHKFRVNQSLFQNSCKLGKFETSYFSFGLYDWSLSIYPSGRSDSQLGTSSGDTGSHELSSMTIYMNRQTGLDRTCRVKFNMQVGEGDDLTESGLRDELSDLDGKSFGWMPRVKFGDCVSHGIFKLLVEMVSVNTVSQVELPVIPPNPIGLPVYDKDKLAWEIETDMNSDTLKFRLIHKDAKNVPRNHIRYVCWSAYLLKKHPKLESKLGTMLEGAEASSSAASSAASASSTMAPDYTAKLPLDQKVYFHYYVQDDSADDGGVLMDTKIPIKEIVDPGSGYLVNRTRIRLHVEWLQSFLLFQSTYHHYDDIIRVQSHQMRQDIVSLKMENEMLERQLSLTQNKSAADKLNEIDHF